MDTLREQLKQLQVAFITLTAILFFPFEAFSNSGNQNIVNGLKDDFVIDKHQQTIIVDLSFNAAKTTKKSKVVLRVLNESNELIVNGDHNPPISTLNWNGQVSYRRYLKFRRELPVGNYKVIAGLIQVDGLRVQVSAGANASQLNSNDIEIAKLTIQGDEPVVVEAPRFNIINGLQAGKIRINSNQQSLSFNMSFNAIPTPVKTRIMIHIYDKDGRIAVNGDHYPPTPTMDWTGKIEYTYEVEFGKSLAVGEYRIVSALFEPDRTRRWPKLDIESGANAVQIDNKNVQIGTLVVERTAQVVAEAEMDHNNQMGNSDQMDHDDHMNHSDDMNHNDHMAHYDHRPNIVDVPVPFSKIASTWNKTANNTTVQRTNAIKDAKNLNGAFRVQCGVSRYLRTDPILNRDPGDPMSHMHTYFGGDVYPGADTDLPDITAQGTGSTCAGGIINKSLYWIPSMLRVGANGEHTIVEPTNFLAYYKNSLNVYGKTESVIFNRNNGVSDKNLIARAMPKELPESWFKLKMISYSYQGDSRVPKGNNTQWECPNKNGGNSKTNGYMPLDCRPGSTMRLQMWFPQCLNVKKQPLSQRESNKASNYSADNQFEWLRYAENRLNDDGCPSDTLEDQWVRIPTISYTVYYKIDPSGNSNWVLSSDHMMGDGRPGSSMHGDFMNGWNKQAAKSWYQDCLLNNKSCTNFYDNVGGNSWIRLIGDQNLLYKK